MPNYGSLVICPYYQYETDDSIVCEGAIDIDIKIKTAVKFSCKHDKKEFQHAYCERYRFKQCPYCKMIDKKYKEDHLCIQ